MLSEFLPRRKGSVLTFSGRSRAPVLMGFAGNWHEASIFLKTWSSCKTVLHEDTIDISNGSSAYEHLVRYPSVGKCCHCTIDLASKGHPRNSKSCKRHHRLHRHVRQGRQTDRPGQRFPCKHGRPHPDELSRHRRGNVRCR